MYAYQKNSDGGKYLISLKSIHCKFWITLINLLFIMNVCLFVYGMSDVLF